MSAPAALPRLHLLAALLAALLALAGCASKNERDMKSGADVLYDRAHSAMDSGNYRNTITYYETLSARFPFSNQAKQAQLDLIYCYYRNGEPESAIDAASQFERENPTHPRVDYALYMRGLANFTGAIGFDHRLVIGLVMDDLAHEKGQAGCAHVLDEASGIFTRRCHWLFAKDMFPGLQRSVGMFTVQMVRRTDRNRLDIRAAQKFFERGGEGRIFDPKPLRLFPRLGLVYIPQRDNFTAWIG